MSFGEIGKEVARRWKELTADQKVPFEKKADEDKKRYSDEMATYVPKEGDAGGKKKASKKASKKAAKNDDDDEEDDEDDE